MSELLDAYRLTAAVAPEDGAAHIAVMRTIAAAVTGLQKKVMDLVAQVTDLESRVTALERA